MSYYLKFVIGCFGWLILQAKILTGSVNGGVYFCSFGVVIPKYFKVEINDVTIYYTRPVRAAITIKSRHPQMLKNVNVIGFNYRRGG